MAQNLILSGDVKILTGDGPSDDPGGGNPKDRDPNEAPETPTDEPKPPRIQDPPPQPDSKGPYTVAGSGTTKNTGRV